MHGRARGLLFTSLFLLLAVSPAHAVFDVEWGSSWDGVPLQDIIDDFLSAQFPGTYSPGDVDVFTNYEGYLPGDADLSPKPYWEDSQFDGLLVQELAGYRDRNTFGWYEIGFPDILALVVIPAYRILPQLTPWALEQLEAPLSGIPQAARYVDLAKLYLPGLVGLVVAGINFFKMKALD
jgi:hypothetical protein